MAELKRRTDMFHRLGAGPGDLALDAWAQARLADLKIDTVVPDPDNPRRAFDEESLRSLARSLKANGLVQPIIVRPGEGGSHVIVAGERRWRAARLAGFVSIRAIVRPGLGDAAARMFSQIAENEDREQLTNRDMAGAIARLVTLGNTHAQIAETIGLDRARVTRLNALADLPSDLDPLLDTIAVDPLYELLAHYKRSPEEVRAFLATNPAPTRAAIRDLAQSTNQTAKQISERGLPRREVTIGAEPDVASVLKGASVKTSPPVDPDVAAAVTPRREDCSPANKASRANTADKQAPIRIAVRHADYGDGWLVRAGEVMPDRLPVFYGELGETIQTLLGELVILAID